MMERSRCVIWLEEVETEYWVSLALEFEVLYNSGGSPSHMIVYAGIIFKLGIFDTTCQYTLRTVPVNRILSRWKWREELENGARSESQQQKKHYLGYGVLQDFGFWVWNSREPLATCGPKIPWVFPGYGFKLSQILVKTGSTVPDDTSITEAMNGVLVLVVVIAISMSLFSPVIPRSKRHGTCHPFYQLLLHPKLCQKIYPHFTGTFPMLSFCF